VWRARKLAEGESTQEETEESGIARPPKPPRKRSSNSPKVFTDTETTKGAGAAGVGGGTLIAIIATALPDGLGKTVLIWLAPTATLTFTAIWIWCRKKIVEHMDDHDAESSFRAARTAIEQALNNPNLTPPQRAEFETKRVQLDQMIVERRLSKAIVHARR
jgi:hypothetical protein